MGPLYLPGVTVDTPDTVIIEDFNAMVWVQNLYISVAFFLFVVFIRDKPEHPPSAVALEAPP